MGTKYEAGRRFEWSVRDKLRSAGLSVFRLAGSKPFDLIAIIEGETIIVECKIRKLIDISLLRKMVIAADFHKVPFLIVFDTYNGIEGYIVGSKYSKDIENLIFGIREEIPIKIWD